MWSRAGNWKWRSSKPAMKGILRNHTGQSQAIKGRLFLYTGGYPLFSVCPSPWNNYQLLLSMTERTPHSYYWKWLLATLLIYGPTQGSAFFKEKTIKYWWFAVTLNMLLHNDTFILFLTCFEPDGYWVSCFNPTLFSEFIHNKPDLFFVSAIRSPLHNGMIIY